MPMLLYGNGTISGATSFPTAATFGSNLSVTGYANVTQGLSTASRGINNTSVPAGSIIQIQQTVLSSILTVSGPNGTATIVSGMSCSITPTRASSKILLMCQLNYSVQGTVTTPGCFFTRNGTAIGIGNVGSGQQRVGFSIPCSSTADTNQAAPAGYNFLDSPDTTSTCTYQLYVNNDNGYAIYFNRSYSDAANSTGKRSISTITLMEIAQ